MHFNKGKSISWVWFPLNVIAKYFSKNINFLGFQTPCGKRGGRSLLSAIFSFFCHYSYYSIELCGMCSCQIATTTTIIFTLFGICSLSVIQQHGTLKIIPLYPFFLWCYFPKAPKCPLLDCDLSIDPMLGINSSIVYIIEEKKIKWLRMSWISNIKSKSSEKPQF